MFEVTFETTDKNAWIRKICAARQIHKEGEPVRLSFHSRIRVEDLYQIHLTTLACLIQHFSDKRIDVYLNDENREVYEYLYNDLQLSEYWAHDAKNHVDARTDNRIFNLWRIRREEMDLYAMEVERYFKRVYFHDRDLSGLSMSMCEAFYNVYDHAKANGNAFSFIRYDETRQKIHIAICDFGCGLCNKVKEYVPEIQTDTDAMKRAIENNFTTKSTMRNKGKGLDNILSYSDAARLFSGTSLLVKLSESLKLYSVDYAFQGTLIYFEVNLSKSDKEEYIQDLEL